MVCVVCHDICRSLKHSKKQIDSISHTVVTLVAVYTVLQTRLHKITSQFTSCSHGGNLMSLPHEKAIASSHNKHCVSGTIMYRCMLPVTSCTHGGSSDFLWYSKWDWRPKGPLEDPVPPEQRERVGLPDQLWFLCGQALNLRVKEHKKP